MKSEPSLVGSSESAHKPAQLYICIASALALANLSLPAGSATASCLMIRARRISLAIEARSEKHLGVVVVVAGVPCANLLRCPFGFVVESASRESHASGQFACIQLARADSRGQRERESDRKLANKCARARSRLERAHPRALALLTERSARRSRVTSLVSPARRGTRRDAFLCAAICLRLQLTNTTSGELCALIKRLGRHSFN